MTIMEEIFVIKSCIEISANDIKVDTRIGLDCAVFNVPSNTV